MHTRNVSGDGGGVRWMRQPMGVDGERLEMISHDYTVISLAIRWSRNERSESEGRTLPRLPPYLSFYYFCPAR